MSLYQELKKRNVFRVAIAYMVIAWVVLQVADLVLDNIGSPDWVIQVMILVIILGLFVSVAISWVYEITPEGIKKEKDIEHDETIENITSKKLDVLVLIALSVIATMFAWDKFYPQTENPTSAIAILESTKTSVNIKPVNVQASSIAVLPFVNMSAEKENEYFSDGLSEELLNLLAKVGKLKVAARTSSFKFKGEKKDISEIGKLLGVAHVLEGSVRKSGSQIRITAQLIKVDDGFHLWSETYDRELKDIFKLQDEIAGAIVDALKLPLLGHDKKPLAESKIENIAAFDLYLLGKHHYRKHDQPGFEKAIEYYNKAIQVDDQFAMAYSGLADSYLYLSDFGNMPQNKAVKIAETAVLKALDLDPNNPEIHAVKGFVDGVKGSLKKQKYHFEKALSLNPNNSNTLSKVIAFYQSNNQYEEAFKLSEKALELDPLSMYTIRQNISLYNTAHRFDEAEEIIRELIDKSPNDPNAYELWGNLFMSKGEPHHAIDKYDKAHKLRPDDIFMASRNVRAALQLNDIPLADYWLNQARSRGQEGQWTQAAENNYSYATFNFKKYLEANMNQSNSSNKALLLYFRGSLQLSLGQLDHAESTLKQSLQEYGYDKNQQPTISQLDIVLLNAHMHDLLKQTELRDELLSKAQPVIQENMKKYPYQSIYHIQNARLSTLKNDLNGTIDNLNNAIDEGFTNHWELKNDPIYQRWQKEAKFNALYQSMLDKAKAMREQYYINNPQLNKAGVTL